MNDVADSRFIETSMGKALVIKRIEQFHEQPVVLDCGLPVFLEDEVAALPLLPPEIRAKRWSRRVADVAFWRQHREAAPGWTILTPVEPVP